MQHRAGGCRLLHRRILRLEFGLLAVEVVQQGEVGGVFLPGIIDPDAGAVAGERRIGPGQLGLDVAGLGLGGRELVLGLLAAQLVHVLQGVGQRRLGQPPGELGLEGLDFDRCYAALHVHIDVDVFAVVAPQRNVVAAKQSRHPAIGADDVPAREVPGQVHAVREFAERLPRAHIILEHIGRLGRAVA